MAKNAPLRRQLVVVDEELTLPPWFDESIHRVEPRGIVLAATGDLLAEDGLPVNAAARAALEAPPAAINETPLAAPSAGDETEEHI